MYNIAIPWCLFSGVWGCASWDRWSGNWLASDHLTDDPQTAKEMPGVGLTSLILILLLLFGIVRKMKPKIPRSVVIADCFCYITFGTPKF